MTRALLQRRLAVTGRRRNLPGWSQVRAFFTAVGSPARGSAVRALGDGIYVTVVLRRRGVRPLIAAPTADARDEPARAATVAAAVDAAFGVLPLAPTCLRRSLVLLREMRRLGLAGELVVGVRRRDDRTEAHAWVEVRGEVVNDDRSLITTYQPFPPGQVERLLPLLP